MKVSNMPGIVKRKSYCFWSLLLFWKPEEYFQYKDLHCWKDKDLIAVVRLFFVIPLTPLKKITCVIHNSYESVLKLRISKVGGNIQQLTISKLFHIWEISAQMNFIFCKHVCVRTTSVPVLTVVFCIFIFWMLYVKEFFNRHLSNIYIYIYTHVCVHTNVYIYIKPLLPLNFLF